MWRWEQGVRSCMRVLPPGRHMDDAWKAPRFVSVRGAQACLRCRGLTGFAAAPASEVGAAKDTPREAGSAGALESSSSSHIAASSFLSAVVLCALAAGFCGLGGGGALRVTSSIGGAPRTGGRPVGVASLGTLFKKLSREEMSSSHESRSSMSARCSWSMRSRSLLSQRSAPTCVAVVNPFPTLFPFKGNRVCDASGIAL